MKLKTARQNFLRFTGQYLLHFALNVLCKSLKFSYTNKQVIEAFKLLAKYDIFPTINNMIGIPDETRETLFETIELNREIVEILDHKHHMNIFTFIPFPGTQLRDVCIEKKYINAKDEIPFSYIRETMLDMPTISKEELYGLEKTMSLYIKLPKKYWADIKIAEQDNEIGKEMFEKLMKLI